MSSIACKIIRLWALQMASPSMIKVTNLAAQLLAVNPRLKPQDQIRLIVDTGERSADGRRHLMHPKKAMERAMAPCALRGALRLRIRDHRQRACQSHGLGIDQKSTP